MVAVLTHIFGLQNIELAEDIVQDVLLKALEQWRFNGVPQNPSGWLMRAAKNKTIDYLRRQKLNDKYQAAISPLLKSEYTINYALNNHFLDNEIYDDQLRMMFVCCHPQLNEESQIALILKTLCGFSAAEIAKSFITNEATVKKRLYRAKEKLKQSAIKFEIPLPHEIKHRLQSVLKTLYLLFNEGYNATETEKLIREDIMEEAIRLCSILSEHESGNSPETLALLALMYFHAARSPARLDVNENILLIEDQDRKLWNREFINSGIIYLNNASAGNVISTYHIEAAIACEHCIAQTYKETNWENILNYYDALLKINNSPVIALNRIIALSEVKGVDASLQSMEIIKNEKSLSSYYLLYAVTGDLYFKKNEFSHARLNFEKAMQLTNAPAEKKLLQKKINTCISKKN